MGRLVPSLSIRMPRVVSKTGLSAAHARGCLRAKAVSATDVSSLVSGRAVAAAGRREPV